MTRLRVEEGPGVVLLLREAVLDCTKEDSRLTRLRCDIAYGGGCIGEFYLHIVWIPCKPLGRADQRTCALRTKHISDCFRSTQDQCE